MDSMKIQKHQAMRNYKKKAQIFFIKVVVYSLAAFLSSLFYWFLFWFPTMKHFISIYLLPNIYSFFFNSKFLFILANIIIAILVVDTKLRSCNPIASRDDVYNKYVEKNQSIKLINKNVNELVTVQDQVLHPLKTVTSCNTMVLHDVADSKKSMGCRTQGQRKRSKRHVHKKTTTSTKDDRELDCNTICVGELVTRGDHEDECKMISGGELVTRGDHEDDCKMISGGELVEFVDKVIDDVGSQANKEGGKRNGREEEKIDAHQDILQKNELNRRADEFIARVNRRRMLEREAWAELHRGNGVSVSS